MNSVEKAIEILQNYSPCSQENLYQVHQVAISALEKQIPKKPAIFFNEEILYCPSCTENVNKDDWYCSQCGQKIDWEDKNENK